MTRATNTPLEPAFSNGVITYVPPQTRGNAMRATDGARYPKYHENESAMCPTLDLVHAHCERSNEFCVAVWGSEHQVSHKRCENGCENPTPCGAKGCYDNLRALQSHK